MATSANYYGLRRGSTKSHTYSVVDGKQITKDRVEGGKDPRTLAQMSQRCMVATIGTAYSAMKSICDHSFEDMTAGMQCMREFMSKNLKEIRISKEENDGYYGFVKYQQSGLVPGSYIISNGSLRKPLINAVVESINVASQKVTLSLVSTVRGSIAEVARAMRCRKFDDMCTIALMYPKADGSYGFGAVRFTYKSGISVLDSFTVVVTGDAVVATPSFTSNTLKVEVSMTEAFASDASIANTYMAAITSRKSNENWLLSPAQFNVTNASPTFDQAIATYPVGKERFLKGGDDYIEEFETDNGSNPSGSTGGDNGSQQATVAAPTISGNTTFSESTEVSISAADGAEIRYTLDGSTPTAESTLYSEAFTVTETTSVKAIAIKDGQTSSVASKTFVKSSGEGGMDQN